jgi:hypothetical protein
LNETLTALTFDESCNGPTSGNIRFDDGAKGNFFELNYTGCNAGTFSYNSSDAGTF